MDFVAAEEHRGVRAVMEQTAADEQSDTGQLDRRLITAVPACDVVNVAVLHTAVSACERFSIAARDIHARIAGVVHVAALHHCIMGIRDHHSAVADIIKCTVRDAHVFAVPYDDGIAAEACNIEILQTYVLRVLDQKCRFVRGRKKNLRARLVEILRRHKIE